MSAIVLRVHDPRHDEPGEIREIEFESGFFPGKGRIAFENANAQFGPRWNAKAFAIAGFNEVSDQEIDQFLNGIRESV